MTVFGLDVSHHQNGNPDFARARAEGIEFVFIKATEGATFIDDQFAPNVNKARAAGMLVAAYHYVTTHSIASQLANIRQAVPPDIPVILDIEAGAAPLAACRTLVGHLWDAGYSVPLTYLPRWYWQQIGSPDLTGLPPLWSSRYPDTVIDSLANEWADVPARYWAGYGGLPVEVLQFTSSARVAGYAPLDANAYRGTRQQLAQLLQGTEEDDDMKAPRLVREKDTTTVWVGDMVTRRHVKDPQTLADYQYQIQQIGGNPNVEVWANIDVLGAPIEMTVSTLTDDEANVIAAIRTLPDPADINEEELAAALAPLVAPLIPEGLTEAQVEAAVRRVFASAGTPTEGTFVMPNLVGMYAADANAVLASLGWTGAANQAPDETTDPSQLGKITRQDPTAGSVTATDATVNVWVATQVSTGGTP